MANKKQSPELWQLTQHWLQLLGNKLNTAYCREEITTHPDYPAITSLVDFLDAGKMQYQAVQADASNIHEFNYPLLAHIRQPGKEYMHIITDSREWDRQKEITQHWSGIAIFPETNTRWQNNQNNDYQKRDLRSKVFAALLLFIGIALFIISGLKQENVFITALGFLSLLGLIISVMLLGTELGYQSNIVKQVCGAVSSGGCEKVMKSKYGKGLLGVTPADASLLYFGSQFFFCLLSSYYAAFSFGILLFAVSGIAVAAWSIYTQAVKIKQWCALCIAIAVFLILQSFIAMAFFTLNSRTHSFNIVGPLLFISVSSFLYFILLPVKQLVQVNNSNRQKLVELKKWKTDAGLFMAQWQQEEQVDMPTWENDLVLGNPGAPVLVTVACNPYCGPCAKAHILIDSLLDRQGENVKVQMRFLFDAKNETDKRHVAVKAILQAAVEINDKTQLRRMLTDWFHWMDLEKWQSKWQAGDHTDVTPLLDRHEKWATRASIQFTPTFFLNGRKLPGRYGIQEIDLLVPQLSELLQPETVK